MILFFCFYCHFCYSKNYANQKYLENQILTGWSQTMDGTPRNIKRLNTWEYGNLSQLSTK